MKRVVALMACLASPLVAQTEPAGPPPETSPLPEQRPVDLGVGPTANAPGENPPAPQDPPPREAPAMDAPGLWQTLTESQADLAACLTALDEMGVVYERLQPVRDEDRDCGIANPLRVSEILPGVAIKPAATIRCDTARAAALWTRDFVQPATERLGRGPLIALQNGSGYICRRRNNLPDGKLSEHSFGNALDVMGFEFADGKPVPIQPRERDGTRAEAFQDAVRATACLEFPTVLGPGADAYHDDHLHLDIKERNGGFRLCQ